MISKKELRSPQNIKNMINEKDYDFFKKNAISVINKIDDVGSDKRIPWNQKVDILIDYFNNLYPSFLDVFIAQSNDCIFRPINKTDEEKVLLEVKESDFYRHLLDNDFNIFLDTYESSMPVKWIIKYDNIKYPQIFSMEYFEIIKEYFKYILKSKNFEDYRSKVNSFFANEMWIFTCTYETLGNNDISNETRTKYHKWWQEYLTNHDEFIKNINEILK